MSDNSQSSPRHAYIKTDRPRGILTSTDRELLLGQKEYESDQALRNARYRIREHIRHSLLDMFLIYNHIDYDELAQVARRQDKLNSNNDIGGAALGLALITVGLQIATERKEQYNDDFEELAENEVESAIRYFQNHTDKKITKTVDVDISIESEKNTDELIEHLLFEDPDVGTVIEYLERGDLELLANKLREHDEEITPNNHSPIGPDDRIVNIHAEQKDHN